MSDNNDNRVAYFMINVKKFDTVEETSNRQ